jgi:hypothetical protein
MLFANHLAVSFCATTLATAYRALTVAQAQIVLLPSTLLPSSAGRGRDLLLPLAINKDGKECFLKAPSERHANVHLSRLKTIKTGSSQPACHSVIQSVYDTRIPGTGIIKQSPRTGSCNRQTEL